MPGERERGGALLRTCSAACLLAASLGAQDRLNVELLGRHDPYDLYTDVWGYRAPTGKEYALVAIDVGTLVVDCTDPTQPVERGLMTGISAPLRDVKTYGPTAYVVSEGGGGIRIIDLREPDVPVNLGLWGGSTFLRAHNIAIDQDTGRIYVVGTGVGTVVYDASQFPREPEFVGIYGNAFVSEYVHDLHVQDGVGHAAMVWTGVYRLIDVTTWPIPTIAEPFTAGRQAHNCWVDETNTLAVTTDEQVAGLTQFWDVSNLAAPVPLSAYSADTQAVVHNAFLWKGHCHVSWYTAGYRLLDLRDPLRPEEVAYFDTHEGPGGTQLGAFGVYPFQPSGNVYVTDRTEGLFVLRPHDLRLRHEPLADTTREDAYRIEARPVSSAPIESVSVHWSTDGQSFSSLPLRPLGMRPGERFEDFVQSGAPGPWVGRIPGQSAPTTVWYYLTARDRAGGNARTPGVSDLHRFDVGTRRRVYFNDFEGAQSWVHGGTLDDFERGTPLGLGGTQRGTCWTDPFQPYSGANVWGNDLGLAGGDGAYGQGASNWLQSPEIGTQGVQGLCLRFQRWLTVEDASSDVARVRVNGQVVWQNGTNHQIDFRWTQVDLDVSAILDGAATAVLRFELATDGDMEIGGWQIDDVELYAIQAE